VVYPHQHDVVDDLVALMTLVAVSCEFNAGSMCEAKFSVDATHGHEGELRLRMSPDEAEKLKVGDVYSVHIRRL
jgi:hypothetical protein